MTSLQVSTVEGEAKTDAARRRARAWPLVTVVALYVAAIALVLSTSWQRNDGGMVYALDDAYIHMAIAKNLATHHVWGVSWYEFTSATSSPLWTLLVAVTYMLFGVNTLSPLLLNITLAVVLLAVCWRILLRDIADSRMVFVALLLVMATTPLPALTIGGMEHVLHALLTLLALYAAADLVVGTPERTRASGIVLLAVAPLLTATRYEGLFLIFIICALLIVVTRRWVFALAVVALSLLPIVAYGLWATSHSWFFLPNSVLLKGARPEFGWKGVAELIAARKAMTMIYRTPHVLLIVLASLTCLAVALRSGNAHSRNTYLLTMVTVATLLHLQFANVGWFYRYEAYLVLAGIMALATTAASFPASWSRDRKLNASSIPFYAAAAALVAIMAAPLETRARLSLMKAPRATTNIYEQQCQMARFLDAYYRDSAVAVNDIGCVAYVGDDLRIVDLWGLANIDVARLRLSGTYDSAQIREVGRRARVKVAIVYDEWFSSLGGIPPEWIRVGQWTIANNVMTGGDTVSFYAVDPTERDTLIRNLRAFSRQLPSGVRQSGEYLREWPEHPRPEQ